MEDFEEHPRQPDVDPSIYLLLSLFLMLLAFFIILSTASGVEKSKVENAIQSLTTTFAPVVPPLGGLPELGQAMEQMVARQEFQDEIREIFGPGVLGLDGQLIQTGDLVEVVVPAGSLFVPDHDQVRPDQAALLDRLAAALSHPRAGLRYFVECIVAAPGRGGDLPTTPTRETLRAAAFVRGLLERGAPPGIASIGLSHGDPTRVRLLFRIRTEEDARLEFRQMER